MKERQEKHIVIQIVLVLVFTILAVDLYLLLSSRYNYDQQQYLQLITERYQLAYSTIYSQYKQLATTLHSGIISRFDIRELYEKLSTADEKEKNRLRTDLLARITPRYKKLLQDAKIRQLHFYLADNESFLRVDRPDKFGDNLTDVRETVSYVNREHKPIDGFEAGRICSGYRFVFPVTANNQKHLGSMEISFGPDAFISSMMKQYKVLIDFYIKEATVKNKVCPVEQEKKYLKSHYGGYLLDKTVLATLRKLSRKEIKRVEPEKETTDSIFINAQSGRTVSLYDSSSNMVLTTIPIVNPVTKEMVAFFTVGSRSDYLKKQIHYFKIIYSLSMLLLLMILFVYYQQYSKRKLLEANSRQMAIKEKQFLDAQKIANIGHWELDINQKLLSVSEQVYRIFNLEPQKSSSTVEAFFERVHPDDLKLVSTAYDDSVKNRTLYDVEHRIITQDGVKKWVRETCTTEYTETGKPLRSLGVIHDITERKRIEEIQRKYEQIISATDDHMAFIDKNYIYQAINNAYLRTFIKTREEIVGHSVAELLGTDVFEHFIKEKLDRTLAGEKTTYKRWFELPGSRWRNMEVSFYPFSNVDGDITGVAISAHDITEKEHARKRLLETNRELKKAIANAEKLATKAEEANRAKSIFLSNMNHELRTPLNAILGYTQLLIEDTSLSAKQRSGIKTMHQSGEHLLMLINDILDFSKIESGKMELVKTQFQLPQFFLEVVDIISGKATRKGLDFQYQTVGTLPDFVEADELRLRQILLNLLSNAVKFTNRGHCTLRIESQLINIKKALLTIAVEDSGTGVLLEMQEKIFEPFQQTGERLRYSEGSGLGLTISQKLVQLMGSKLQLVSPVNKEPGEGEGPGSRFLFTIELLTSSGAAITARKKRKVTGYSIADKKNGRKKILIVDDSKSNRAVLRDSLESLNFIIEEAIDGSEVLRFCKKFQPDAILMDLRMPNMDGFTARKLVQNCREFAHIPVIAITASTAQGQKYKHYCMKLGFNGFITKPYFTAELLEILADQLALDLQYSTDIAADSDEPEIIPPPKVILRDLTNLVQSGDISGIIKQAAEIARMESGKYNAFALMIKRLADDFFLLEIEQFITKYKKER